MRRIGSQITMVLVLLVTTVLCGNAADKEKLENSIMGWISAVNQGDYVACLNYIAPHRTLSGKGLTRMVRGGEEFLFFSGDILLPLRSYTINTIDFFNKGNQSKVVINAQVIYQRKTIPMEGKGNVEANAMVFPATITQQWILLKGKWYIMSQLRLQYLGS
jgi:hypothetical protein